MAIYKSLIKLEPAGKEHGEVSLTFMSSTHSRIVDTFLLDCLADCTTFSITHSVSVENQFFTSDKGPLVCKYNKRIGVKCKKDVIKFLSMYRVHNALGGNAIDLVFTFSTAVDMATLSAYLTASLGKALISVKHYRRRNATENWYQTNVLPTRLEYPEDGVGNTSDKID